MLALCSHPILHAAPTHSILHPLSVLVVLLAIKDPKNSQEEIDNIQVERDRRSNLLFDMVMPHDELRVHQNVPAEEESGRATIDELSSAVVGEEGRHEAEEYQNPKSTEEVWLPGGEVIFALTRKQSKRDEDPSCEHQSQKHDFCVVE